MTWNRPSNRSHLPSVSIASFCRCLMALCTSIRWSGVLEPSAYSVAWRSSPSCWRRTGEIKHLYKLHGLFTGSRTPQPPQWLQPFAQLLSSSEIDFNLSENIDQAMWDKIVFLSTLAGSSLHLPRQHRRHAEYRRRRILYYRPAGGMCQDCRRQRLFRIRGATGRLSQTIDRAPDRD